MLSGCAPASTTSTVPPAPSPAIGFFFTNPFTVGVKYDQPGFGTNSGTDYEGFDVNLAKELGNALNFTPTFVRVDDTNRETGMGINFKLVIASYSITQGRAQGTDGAPPVDFAGPYLQSPEGLLVRAGGPLDTSDPNIDHAKICVIKGSTPDDIPLPNPRGKSTGTTYTDCLALLERGRTDAVLTDWLVLYGYVQAHLYSNLNVVWTHYGEINQYGIGLPAGQKDACQAIARFLAGYVGTTQWASDLTANFSDIAKNYPGPRSTQTDWRNVFKPKTPNGYHAYCK
jgi:glutamate transport system substrate-binding protein